MSDTQVVGASYPLQFVEEITDAATKRKQKRIVELRMVPFSDRDISELDVWVRVNYIRAARAAAEGLEKEQYETEIRVAQMTAAQLTAFSGLGAKMLATVDGMARIVWQGCKDNHPDLTQDKIRALLFNQRNLVEANRAMEELNFSPAVSKNSTKNSASESTKGDQLKQRKKQLNRLRRKG